jgi:biotin transport system substrate-specific component
MFAFVAGIPRFIVVTLTELMWALTGLLLTIGGNFVKAAMLSPGLGQSPAYFLGVTYQIGAVLLIGCMGGRNAAVVSQIAYLALGIAGFPIFSQGGGIGYFHEMSFGYLLGFVPAAWICGHLAFRALPRLEWLTGCCMAGLAAIHATGIAYLALMYSLHFNPDRAMTWSQSVMTYSLQLLPGQIGVVCAVAVTAFLLRRAMFY